MKNARLSIKCWQGFLVARTNAKLDGQFRRIGLGNSKGWRCRTDRNQFADSRLARRRRMWMCAHAPLAQCIARRRMTGARLHRRAAKRAIIIERIIWVVILQVHWL